MRVVLDTNVWVSGLLWRGTPWQVLRLAEDRRIQVYASPSMLEELFGVLSRAKFRPRLEQLGLTVADLRAYVTSMVVVLELPDPLSGAPIVAADPDDDVFLLCALQAEARCVVSGDLPLLGVGEYRGVPILSVPDFLVRYFPELPSG